MFSTITIRKVLGYLVLISMVLVTALPFLFEVRQSAVEPDDTRTLVILAWVLFSLAHALISIAGQSARLMALCGLGLWGWLFYNEWTRVTDPAYVSVVHISPAWIAWLCLATILVPVVDQLLDIILPPWPWSRD